MKTLSPKDFPERLNEIPDPPKQLHLEGNMPPEDAKLLCVVGARKCTSYGKEVCAMLIEGLRGHNVSIVSGLALGIDALAHESALKTGLHTLAVPGSGLSRAALHPKTNAGLANKIIKAGGGMISEFEPDFRATQWSFPQRNRIMAGLSHAVLVIEAEKRSGTLITSRLATEYNRDVLTIPHSIFSRNAEGPHMLMRLGATPITCVGDLLDALGLHNPDNDVNPDGSKKTGEHTLFNYDECSLDEKRVVALLHEPIARDEIVRTLGEQGMSVSGANTLLSAMELKDLIKETLGQVRLK